MLIIPDYFRLSFSYVDIRQLSPLRITFLVADLVLFAVFHIQQSLKSYQL